MGDIVDYLKSFREWSKLSPSSIEASADQLAKCVGEGFEWSGVVTTPSGNCIASFRHLATSMIFNLVPGGKDSLGLSNREYEAVKDLPKSDIELLNGLMPAEEVEVQ